MNGAIRITERRAFTLIELLVVISIIGVLMGLILSGVQRFRIAAKRAQAVVEINQLSAACDTFKNEYGFYPPSTFTGTSAADVALLKRMYPHWNGTGFTPPAGAPLQGGQCMVYFLGGPNGTGWDYGFPRAPATTAASKKIFFDFPTGRVTNYRFVDPWGSITETPLRSYYKYVSPDTTTGKYVAAAVDGIAPYQRSGSGKYENDGKCQIFSAGNNKTFATGGTAWTPGSGIWGGYNSPGADDLANFNGGVQLGSIP